ncbi:MAG: DUF3842 family protein [Lachnospiraceae bacterium]|nr:DUF3842 family protein [Lachnospiraceae bacterium]
MNILVIDAQGGGLGKQLITSVKEQIPGAYVTAVGTNATATANMLKAGADFSATGENAVKVCVKEADVIVGPVGICITDAMGGEITKKMAAAVGRANAKRILIPFNNCNTFIVGTGKKKISALIEEAVAQITGTEKE